MPGIESVTFSSGDKSVTITDKNIKQFKKRSIADDLTQKEAQRVTDKENEAMPLLKPANVGGVSGERLIQLLERVERMEEEKAGLADDIRDVYAEAKSAGYETKIMRQIVKLRKMDRQKRQEQEEMLDLYKSAIGME